MSIHFRRVEEGVLKATFFNLLGKLESFVYAFLCLVFLLALGAGLDRIYLPQSKKCDKISIKTEKAESHGTRKRKQHYR